MNSDVPMETAANFFLANVFLKQLLGLWGARTDNYKMKTFLPMVGFEPGTFHLRSELNKRCAICWDLKILTAFYLIVSFKFTFIEYQSDV